jgi:glutathione S-transferase
MLLLQFSTSHYCRKARLALGYKHLTYTVENLTPGLHAFKLQPLTGTTTVPVLLPQLVGQPEAIADSTHIFEFLDTYQPDPPLYPSDPTLRSETQLLEDWLDESIGTATRFVYYDYRAKEGKQLDPSLVSQAVIQIVRRQYGMNPARVRLAADRLSQALAFLERRWWPTSVLVGDRLSAADITAAALLSPLARLPDYRQAYPWLFDHIAAVHRCCQAALPPGLE